MEEGGGAGGGGAGGAEEKEEPRGEAGAVGPWGPLRGTLFLSQGRQTTKPSGTLADRNTMKG